MNDGIRIVVCGGSPADRSALITAFSTEFPGSTTMGFESTERAVGAFDSVPVDAIVVVEAGDTSDTRDSVASLLDTVTTVPTFVLYSSDSSTAIPVDDYENLIDNFPIPSNPDDRRATVTRIHRGATKYRSHRNTAPFPASYRSVLDGVPEGLLVVDNDGTIHVANEAAETVLYRSADSVAGTTIEDVFHDSAIDIAKNIRTAIDRGDPFEPIVCRLSEGQSPESPERWFEIAGTPTSINISSGLVLSIRDVSERMALEAELNERRKELDGLHKTARILESDAESLQSTLSELVETVPTWFQHPDRTTARLQYGDLVVSGSDFESLPTRLTVGASTDRGRDISLEVVLRAASTAEITDPFLPEERSLVESVVRSLRQHIDRRESIAERNAVKDRLETYLEYSNDLILVIDDDLHVRYASPSTHRITGHEPTDVIGADALDFVHPDDRDAVEAVMLEMIANPETVTERAEHRLRLADGSFEWFESVGGNRTETTIDGYVINSRNISDRKRRQRQQALFKRAVEEAGHSVVITDTDGTIEYVNPAFESITGFSRSTAIGKNPRILKSGKHDDRFYSRLWETILDGEVWRAELVNQRADGTLFHVYQTIAPVTDSTGEITHFVGIESDITDRRLREQRLDVLNRIFRHNVRNGMNVVTGHAEKLATSVPSDHSVAESAATIREQAERLIEIGEKAVDIQSTFSTDLSHAEQTCNLVAQIESVVETFADRFPEVRIQYPDEAEVIVIGDERIELAIAEAIENAIIHNDSTNPTVRITLSDLTGNRREGWVALGIADNGPGIPRSERRMIETGEETQLLHGTGIGLWVIEWAIASVGGEVRLSEVEPQGTTLEIYLPTPKSCPHNSA